MRTKFVETVQGLDTPANHGKFMVALFEHGEWARPSAMDAHMGHATSLVGRTGWTHEHVLVMDLETGEGAMFKPGGSPSADLDKHKVWVCPMFEPFLEWLYGHVRSVKVDLYVGEHRVEDFPVWFATLPEIVELPDADFEWAGYRRPGEDTYMTERAGILSTAVGLARLALDKGDPEHAQRILDGAAASTHKLLRDSLLATGADPEKVDALIGSSS